MKGIAVVWGLTSARLPVFAGFHTSEIQSMITSTVDALLFGTVLMWTLGIPCMAASGNRCQQVVPAGFLFSGAGLLLALSCCGWQSSFSYTAPLPIYLAVAPLSIRMDGLSAIFAGLLAVVSMAVSLFSPDYLEHIKRRINTGAYWAQMFLFVLGMLGVILASNAVTFLVFWELFALASVLLIATDLTSHKSRIAAFIYLGATRVATTLLLAGFLWMHSLSGSWNFDQWHLSAGAAFWPALLILIGLCIKTGIWPFQDWLPYAHPAAPSPVSALMSGVMIKVSIYAIIRILVMGGLTSLALTYLMLAIGLISAFWGITWALMQRDLKTLLAYCSIENVGLILTGISLALLCHRYSFPGVAALALAAAIFHCINHGLFKSLLFLTAGTIDARVHTLDLERMGGLCRYLPFTMFCFFAGSAAICSLPPFNGFSSKWLLYQAFFQLACVTRSFWIGCLSIVCISILGLASGLGLYCFTKAVGIAFLGRPRSANVVHAKEGSKAMLIAQALLVACCLLLGVMAPLAMAVVEPVCRQIFGSDAGSLAAVYTIPMAPFAVFVGVVAAIIFALWLSDRSQGKHIQKCVTWECGFGELDGRMQATATGFAENVAYTFAPLFEYHAKFNISGRDRRHFPEGVSLELETHPILEEHVYAPAVGLIRWLGERVLMLQTGSIHLYLSYILITLVALMVIGVIL